MGKPARKIERRSADLRMASRQLGVHWSAGAGFRKEVTRGSSGWRRWCRRRNAWAEAMRRHERHTARQRRTELAGRRSRISSWIPSGMGRPAAAAPLAAVPGTGDGGHGHGEEETGSGPERRWGCSRSDGVDERSGETSWEGNLRREESLGVRRRRRRRGAAQIEGALLSLSSGSVDNTHFKI